MQNTALHCRSHQNGISYVLKPIAPIKYEILILYDAVYPKELAWHN
jgi:hypothetical protein